MTQIDTALQQDFLNPLLDEHIGARLETLVAVATHPFDVPEVQFFKIQQQGRHFGGEAAELVGSRKGPDAKKVGHRTFHGPLCGTDRRRPSDVLLVDPQLSPEIDP